MISVTVSSWHVTVLICITIATVPKCLYPRTCLATSFWSIGTARVEKQKTKNTSFSKVDQMGYKSMALGFSPVLVEEECFLVPW